MKARQRCTGTYIVLIIGSVLMIVPFLWMLLTSFKTQSECTQIPVVFIPKAFQFHNYADVANFMHFDYYYLNTVLAAVFKTAGAILIGSMAAYSFARIQFPGRNFLFTIVLSVFMIPWQCFLIPNFLLMAKWGWTDTLRAIIVPGMFSAYSVFLLRQTFMSMPKELEEAAIIDGCSQLGVYFRIMLPLARSAIAAVSTMLFLWSWNDLLWPLVVNHSDSKLTLAVGLANLVGQYTTSYPQLMAGAVMASIPMVVIFVIFQEQIVQGIAFSGLKA